MKLLNWTDISFATSIDLKNPSNCFTRGEEIQVIQQKTNEELVESLEQKSSGMKILLSVCFQVQKKIISLLSGTF